MNFLAALNPTTALASVAGAGDTLASLWGQRYANRSNIQQAEIARDYNTTMSNSSHQRAVADLNAAGLNPMLAATGGATTPMAQAPRVENPVPNMAFSNALQSMKVLAEIEETDARATMARESIPGVVAGSRMAVTNANAQDALVKLNMELLGMTAAERRERQPYNKDHAALDVSIRENEEAFSRHRADRESTQKVVDEESWRSKIDRQKYEADMTEEELRLTRNERRHSDAVLDSGIRRELNQTMLEELQLPGARAEAKAWSSRYGQSGRAYVRDAAGIGSLFSSASSMARNWRWRR